MSDGGALGRYFDELSGGESFETAGRTITESDLVSFSALTGDWHPQHADAEWAGAGPFGSRVAHGMLLLSYSLGLAPIDPERVVALRGLDSVRFKRPVRIGETIRVRGTVRDLRSLDQATGLVTLDWKVLGQAGRVAVRAELQAIWRRRPPLDGDRRRDAGVAARHVPASGAATGAGQVGDAELSPLQDGRVLV